MKGVEQVTGQSDPLWRFLTHLLDSNWNKLCHPARKPDFLLSSCLLNLWHEAVAVRAWAHRLTRSAFMSSKARMRPTPRHYSMFYRTCVIPMPAHSRCSINIIQLFSSPNQRLKRVGPGIIIFPKIYREISGDAQTYDSWLALAKVGKKTTLKCVLNIVQDYFFLQQHPLRMHPLVRLSSGLRFRDPVSLPSPITTIFILVSAKAGKNGGWQWVLWLTLLSDHHTVTRITCVAPLRHRGPGNGHPAMPLLCGRGFWIPGSPLAVCDIGAIVTFF